MPGISRVGVDVAGGVVTGNLAPTVFVNGKEIDRNTQYMNLDGFKAALVAAGRK